MSENSDLITYLEGAKARGERQLAHLDAREAELTAQMKAVDAALECLRGGGAMSPETLAEVLTGLVGHSNISATIMARDMLGMGESASIGRVN